MNPEFNDKGELINPSMQPGYKTGDQDGCINLVPTINKILSASIGQDINQRAPGDNMAEGLKLLVKMQKDPKTGEQIGSAIDEYIFELGIERKKLKLKTQKLLNLVEQLNT